MFSYLLRYDLAAMNETRSGLSAVLFNDSIIVVGGVDINGRSMSSVECYSFSSKKWSRMPPMLKERYVHCACVFDGKVFVVGGESTNSIEFYDPSVSSWTLHKNLDIPRKWSSVFHI